MHRVALASLLLLVVFTVGVLPASAASAYPMTLASPYPAADGDFGYSMAVSGVLVVGEPGYTLNQIAVGAAHIFNLNTGALTHTLISPNPQGGGEFGYSVAVSGAHVVVGAFGEDVGPLYTAGRAYVFDANSGSLLFTLTSPNPHSLGRFGWAVAASDSVIVVGAPWDDAGDNTFGGFAYVFNTTTGALIASLTSTLYGHFGYSVAVSNGVVVVGAAAEALRLKYWVGRAYVFDAPAYVLAATLSSRNPQKGGEFGYAVTVSGGLIIVGAPWETTAGKTAAGKAYVFNATTGSYIRTLSSPRPKSPGWFGHSVAVSRGSIYIGSKEIQKGVAGAGDVYRFNATTWVMTKTFTSPNGQDGGYFGLSAAASGRYLVVGAYGEAVGPDSEAGHAYIFRSS